MTFTPPPPPFISEAALVSNRLITNFQTAGDIFLKVYSGNIFPDNNIQESRKHNLILYVKVKRPCRELLGKMKNQLLNHIIQKYTGIYELFFRNAALDYQ